MPAGQTIRWYCALGAVFALIHLGLPCHAEGKRSPVHTRELVAKHIILFIGDGMQLEHEIAASRYLFGKDDGLSFHDMPYRNHVSTWDVTTYNAFAESTGKPLYSPSSIVPSTGYDPLRGGYQPYPMQTKEIDDAYFVFPCGDKTPIPCATDSAPSATAWATGHKTDAGNVSWLPGDPPDGKLLTIAELLRAEKHFAIGVVSTVPFSHATPAAFVSHNADRGRYHDIAHEILKQSKPEVVIGGGHPCPDPEKGCNYQYISADLFHAMKEERSKEYLFAERAPGKDGALSLLLAAQEAAGTRRRLLGLFGGPEGNFECPIPQDAPGAPVVNRRTAEDPRLRDATLAALTVLSRNKDGFFLMVEQGDIDWANHANDYSRMVGTVWDLHEAVRSAMDFVDRDGDEIRWDNTLLIVTSDHGNGFMRLNTRKPLGAGDLPARVGAAYPDGEVLYRTTHHTNELTRVYARGTGLDTFYQHEGQWYPCHRILDNTQLYHIMAAAAGVPQRVPLRIQANKSRCVRSIFRKVAAGSSQ